jgi:hypothetical protein
VACVSSANGSTDERRQLSASVLAFQLAIIGLCLAGPVFNTQLGVVFWIMTGALYGAMESWNRSEFAETDGLTS